MANALNSAPDATDVVKQFQQVLGSDPDGKGPLYIAWQFLQVYSVWGLRLPTTEADLKQVLGISDPSAYVFFDPMEQAYKEISDTSKSFLSDVFPEVVALGNTIHSFAKDATGKDGTFSAVNDLLDQTPPDGDDALALLQDLQTQAKNNATKADEVATKLSAYKASLTKASGDLTAVQTKVETDAKTKQSTIDTLSSNDPKLTGSIANLNQVLADKQDEYNQDVIVATTTVTYAWALFPVGLICAASVAGVYGQRAVDALNAVDKAKQAAQNANQELASAVATHSILQTADKGVTNALTHTNDAIGYTTTVQNAWNQLDSDLNTILTKVDFTTGENGLKAASVIKIYLKQAMNAWQDLLTPLDVLTKDPFITVAPGTLSLGDLAKQVESYLEKAAAPKHLRAQV